MSLAQRRKEFGHLPKKVTAHKSPAGSGKRLTAPQISALERARKKKSPRVGPSSVPADTSGPTAIVTWLVATDPFGDEAAVNGSPIGLADRMGAAVPGESFALSATIFQSGDSANTEDFHPVKVEWQITNDCTAGGSSTMLDFDQTVSAPNLWVSNEPDAPAPPVVNAVIPIPAGACTRPTDTYSIWACTQVMDNPTDTMGCGAGVFFVVVPALPATAEHGCMCGDLSGAPRSDVQRADPVNTATGAFAESFNDASVPGVGVAFAATRSYSSDVTTSGALGQGWSLPWESSLEVDSSGNVLVHGESGALHAYAKNSDGTFTPADGGRSTLTAVSGGYSMTTLDHRTYTFDTDGHLTSEKNASGQGLTLAYTAGVLTSITDAAGRSVALAYTGGLLSKLTLADGRHVDYGYTSGQLTSVTALDGATTTYGYDTGGRLNSITDALDHRQVFNVYDDQGRVVSQTNADSHETTFAYTTTGVFNETDTTAPDGGVWTDIYAGNMLFSQEDPLGDKSFYRYDDQYNRTDAVDGNGHETSWDYYDSGLLKDTKTDGVDQWTYDTAGNPATHTDGELRGTSFTYGADNLLSKATDGLGKDTTYLYWPNGELKSVTTPLGHTTAYTYNPDGSLQQVTTPEGRKTTYTYDVSGRLKTVVDPRGNADGADPAQFTTTYGYDDADRVTSVTDANGHETTTQYDAAGNVHIVTDPAQRVTTYDYDNANLLTKVTDPAQHTTLYGYDAAGRRNSVTDRTGATTTSTYDKAGNVDTMVTARGHVPGADPTAYTWTYGYDHVGNRISTTDPLGHTTAFGYDDYNRPLSTTDPNGHATSVVYDSTGNVTFQYDALNDFVTRFDYDNDNRLEATTNGANKTTTYEFDDDGNLTGQLSPMGEHTTYGYDGDGLRTTTVDPNGHVGTADPAMYTWTTHYDAAGEPDSVTDPKGHVTRTGYDHVGNIISTTDALNHETDYTYDALDRIHITTVPASGTTTYDYDTAGNLFKVTDPNTHITTYGYDNEGRVTSVTDPLNHTVGFAYDAEGNRYESTNARGQTITSTIDSRDLTGKITYSDGTPSVTYTYDNAGRMQTVADATGTRTLTYYDTDLLKTATSPGAAQPFSYTYNIDHTLKQRTDPDGASTTYTYDNDSRVSGETTAEPGNAGNTTTYGYDAAGRLTTTTLPTVPAVTQTRTYDNDGLMKSLETTNQEGHYFTRDTDGRVIADRPGTGQHGEYGDAHRFAYDDAGRVTRDCIDPSEAADCLAQNIGQTYTYDPAGNLKTATNTTGSDLNYVAQTTTNTYDDADELAQADTATTTFDGTTTQTQPGPTTIYGYDNDGDQTKAGSTTSTYDPAGRVTTSTTGTTTYAYTYDADGNRTTTKKNGALTDTTLWDINNPLPQIATETNATGALVGDYFYDPQGTPQSVNTTTSNAYYYLQDRQNSVTAVIDATGAMTSQYTYGTFGTPTENPNDAGGQKSAFGFTGQYKDPNLTGDLDLRARTLDTTTGRFTTRDPVAPSIGSANPSKYAYAANDPANESDPSGDCPECITALVGAGIGGLVSASVYTWQHHDGGWDWSDFAAATGKGTLIGFGAGLLAPVGGEGAGFLGFESGTAGYYATAATLNGVTQAAYTWGVYAAQCQPVTPQDLLFSFAGGAFGTYAGPAFQWARGLFGDADAAANVGNLRFGPGGGGTVSGYGGIPYKTPETPQLKALVNPQGGLTNCRGCVLSVDQLLAGGVPSSAVGSLQAGPQTALEGLYGRKFVPTTLSGIVKRIKDAGNGARGIVSGSKGRDAHVFNVVNINGDVIFLDAQTGHARPQYWRHYQLMRTD